MTMRQRRTYNRYKDLFTSYSGTADATEIATATAAQTEYEAFYTSLRARGNA